jgi:uncharacterized protein
MSRNIEAVKAIYQCFGTGDIAGLLARLHADIEWEHDWNGTPLPWLTPRRGRAGVAEFFQKVAADVDFTRFEPAGFLEGDGMVAAPIHVEMIVKATGKRFRDLEMHLWTFGADGLATRFRHLMDTHQVTLVTAA